MGDHERAAWVGDATGCGLHQTELAVGGPKQHDAGVAGHAAAVKLAFHHTPAKTVKFDLVVCGLRFPVYSLALAVPCCDWLQIPMTTRLRAGLPTYYGETFGLGHDLCRSGAFHEFLSILFQHKAFFDKTI